MRKVKIVLGVEGVGIDAVIDAKQKAKDILDWWEKQHPEHSRDELILEFYESKYS